MVERLQVVTGNFVVAILERRQDGRLTLTYSDQAVQIAAGQILLSTSLPVRAERYDEAALYPFFEGLLPEGGVRERLMARLRLAPSDIFGLLRTIGRDCAGAYSIVPEGVDLQLAREEGVRWMSRPELRDEIRQLAARPLAVEPDQDIRISLAGAQDKMAVAVDDARIGLPMGTTPSTHILKPASQVVREGRRGGRLAYPALVNNEAFCMTLGRLAGLRVATVELVDIAGEAALLVERFDRRRGRGGRVERVHQEDFCQALGYPSQLKYERDGGPDLADYLDLLGRVSAAFDTDAQELVDRIAFNYLIGNADAHAKNFSVLLGDQVGLAPAYDVLSTYVYPHLSFDMATSINKMFDSRAIQPAHWQKQLNHLDLNERLYAQRLSDLADRIDDALPEALHWVGVRGLRHRRVDGVVQLIRQRTKVLRGVRALPAARRGRMSTR